MMKKISGTLERKALVLGMANAVDFGLQFLLPVVLARALDVEAFGKYRLLWLAVLTTTSLVPLAMPQSLYYFMPRSDATRKRLYVNQTLLFLCATSFLAALFMSPLNPWRPAAVRGVTDPDFLVAAFVFLWNVASLLDTLPTVDERIHWQAKLVVCLSGLRAISLSLVAIATREFAPILVALMLFVLFKLWLMFVYLAKHHGLGRPLLEWKALRGQIAHAAPIGLSGALYGLRIQADQWVAASLFPLGMFAAFSVAAVIGPMLYICRLSVNQVFLPSMSRLEAGGDVAGMLGLNSRANVMVGALAYPLLAFAFVFAEDIISVIYTASYIEAAPVMRVYVFGLAALVVELGTVMLLLKEGPFALRTNAVLLMLSASLSWYAAREAGLAGAAAGSVLAVYCDRFLTLRRISRRTGIPISRMQDWRALARLVCIAAVSVAIVWLFAHEQLTAQRPIARIAAVAPTMAFVYLVLYAIVDPDGRITGFIRRRARNAWRRTEDYP